MKDRREDCRGCGLSTLLSLIDLRNIPIGGHLSIGQNTESTYPIGLVICANCGLVQLKYEVSPSVIFGQEIGQVIEGCRAACVNKSWVKNACQIILRVGGLSTPELEYSENNDYQVVSLEAFLLYRAIAANAPIGSLESLLTEVSTFEFLDLYGPVEEIQITNVTKGIHPLHLSNVGNLSTYLQNLLRLLKQNGKVIVRFPSINEIVEGAHVEYIYHEHQSYFDAASLDILMSAHGLRLVGWCNSQDNLNVEMSFQNVGKCPTAGEFSAKINVSKDNLETRMFQFQEIESSLSYARSTLRDSWQSCRPKKCVGYGASIAAITAMYQLELDRSIDFLIDDDERKVGLFSPESNIPVMRSEGIESQAVGLTVILVPRFEKQILDKSRRGLGRIRTASVRQLERGGISS